METPWVLVTCKEVKNYFKRFKRGELEYASCKVTECIECEVKTCNAEIEITRPDVHLGYYRKHLLTHKILDKDRTVPEDLQQDYTDLREYEAKCNHCNYTRISYLWSTNTFKKHLEICYGLMNRSQHEPSTSTSTATAMGPSAESQQLPPDSSSLQSQTGNETRLLDKPSTSSSIDYDVDTSAERQIQERPDSSVSSSKQQLKNFMDLSAESEEPLDLSFRSCGQRRKETRALDQPSTPSSTNDFMDPYADYQEPLDLSFRSCKKTRKETAPLDKSVPSTSTSSVALANFDPTASQPQCGDIISIRGTAKIA